METNGDHPELRFPDGFVWGAATASYQIEGAVQEDGRGESIWDRFSHTPGKVLNGDTGDVACDSYHRWREDIDLLRALTVNAYRFSVAWPRIFPAGRGAVNEAGLAYYDRLVDGLLAAGITPWITLYHWDLPQALEDEGGWPNRATVEAFVSYVDAVTRRLGDRVKHWITINEPWVVAFLGYWLGHHAPGRTNLTDAIATTHHLLLAHGEAVPVVRANVSDARVGITLNLAPAYPATDSEADRAAARRQDGFLNRWFLDPLYLKSYPQDTLALWTSAPPVQPGDLDRIAVPTDFLGVNYYTPSYVRDDPDAPPIRTAPHRPDGEYTAMDWLVEPGALTDLLRRLGREYPTGPLSITENGAAYPDEPPRDGRVHDPDRIRYYHGHLTAAHAAISAGAPLAGYFAWSLLDNFEWAFGYDRRFGLVSVDFATGRRTIKDSGRWYARVARENRVVPVAAAGGRGAGASAAAR